MTVSSHLSTVYPICLYITWNGKWSLRKKHSLRYNSHIFWDLLKDEPDNVIVSSCELNIQMKMENNQSTDRIPNIIIIR
jgi:hypothetical protein